MNITASNSFRSVCGLGDVRASVQTIKAGLKALPQYEPETKHYFHGGMYCREVKRDANVTVVGAVHKKEHLYVIVSGTVAISDGRNPAQLVTGPCVIKSHPGTERVVSSITEAVCMTFHVTNAKTVEEAEAELVEADPDSMYLPGNIAKYAELAHEIKEVLK